MSSRHASLALINTLPSLFFSFFSRSASSCHLCVLHAVLGWILHRAEQQVFAGRNSDTWMRTVRLLIRDSASPLSPHLERRGDAQTHTLTRAPKYECTAGGHLSAGQIKAGKVRGSSAESIQKVFVYSRSSMLFSSRVWRFFFQCRAAPPYTTLLSTRVTNMRIKTNLKVTVASVTMASGLPPTLWGGQSIWQVLRMRGVLIDENHFAASKHIYRDETCVKSNSWRSFREVWGFSGEMALRLKLKLFILEILNSGLRHPTQR